MRPQSPMPSLRGCGKARPEASGGTPFEVVRFSPVVNHLCLFDGPSTTARKLSLIGQLV
jgi:hypothetical protein